MKLPTYGDFGPDGLKTYIAVAVAFIAVYVVPLFGIEWTMEAQHNIIEGTLLLIVGIKGTDQLRKPKPEPED